MNFKSKGMGVAAGVVSVVVIISFFWGGGNKSSPTFSSADAFQELKNPRNEGRAAAAMKSVRAQGEEALPQLLDLYQHPPKPESRSFAENLLTALPATPKVVEALVQLMANAQTPVFRLRLAGYLTEASGQKLAPTPEAWQQWWEQEGKSQTTFNAPYGTKPAGNSTQK